MIAFSSSGIIVGKVPLCTEAKDFPSKTALVYDQVSWLSSDAGNLPNGSKLPKEFLDPDPTEPQTIYAHINLTGNASCYTDPTTGIIGMPTDVSQARVTFICQLRFGREASDTLLPLHGHKWLIHMSEPDTGAKVLVKIDFVNGTATKTIKPTANKRVGQYSLSETQFSLIPLDQDTLTALGVSGEPGNWQVKLAAPVRLDIFENEE
jgi:hypothetical protein